MNCRQLGGAGPWLTEIGLGTWAIGGPWTYGWGPQDDNDSIRTIHEALDLGINWIDTAAVYGRGHSEEVVGRALRGRRDKVFVATKCARFEQSPGKVVSVASPELIPQQAEDSLRRLQTDYLDLYQVHWPDPNVPVDQTWSALVKLQDQGKVRHIGVSNFDVAQLAACERVRHVNSAQPPYSLINRAAEAEILPWCQAHGVGVVAYSPLQSGLLTGQFDRARLAPDDWRRLRPQFNEPQLGQNLALVEQLRPLARKYGKTVGELAIAWVLLNPAVTSAIVGARRPGQIKETIGGAGWQIAPEDAAAIRSLLG